jgi:hypothetical protein
MLPPSAQESLHYRTRTGRGRRSGAAPLGLAENWSCSRAISAFDEFQLPCARRKRAEVKVGKLETSCIGQRRMESKEKTLNKGYIVRKLRERGWHCLAGYESWYPFSRPYRLTLKVNRGTSQSLIGNRTSTHCKEKNLEGHRCDLYQKSPGPLEAVPLSCRPPAPSANPGNCGR